MICSNCRLENPESFAFCGRCGSRIAPSAQSGVAESRHLTSPERRQLTLMFCDMVGSTALSGRVDPEDLADIELEYHKVCHEIVERHEGRIAHFLGDGLLVYFGYPKSHEDDGQRAVRAGLEIVQAVSRLPVRHGQALEVRIGIHTGLAVIGQAAGAINADPMAVTGETPNIAARLEAFAAPNSVVISQSTYRLIEGFFLCRSLGTPELKGVATPLQVFAVLRETGIHTRFEKMLAVGLTPIVGREKELEGLLHRWRDAVEGRGQVVMVSGEAGIGKSRLMQALIDQTGNGSVTELHYRCSPYYRNSAIYPAIDLLQRVLAFDRNDDSESKLSKLESQLTRFNFEVSKTLPLFAHLLSLPIGDRYPILQKSPKRQKQMTLEAIVEWLLRIAKRKPTRLIVEDLHWADPSTLELIDLLIERLPSARLFLALVSRPEFSPPWPSQPYSTSITLERLPRQNVELMLQSLVHGKSLPIEVVDQIVAKTEGVPLFVEELTRTVLESGMLHEQDDHYALIDSRLSLSIPSTLYDSLMVRLDRLGAAREVAQLGSAIGRDFSYELLRAISPLNEAALTAALNRLVDSELLDQSMSQNQLKYSFRHALVRDAAYESLLKSQRRNYHRKIAAVLSDQFPEHVEARPELLADHFTEAGLIAEAIPCWQKAGQRAFQRSANTEAIRLFATAIELQKQLAKSGAGDAQELDLYLDYLQALNVSGNWSSVDTGAAYERARQLCERMGETSRLFRVLLGQSVFYQGRDELRRAYDIALQVNDLAQRSGKTNLRLRSGWLLGTTLYYLGELLPAHDHLLTALRLHTDDSGSHGSLSQRIDCLSVDAEVMWMLGFSDQAQQIGNEALALARSVGRPWDLALALTHAHMLNWFRRDYERAIEFADEGLTLCASKNFGFLETALAWSRDNTRIFMGVECDAEALHRKFTAYHKAGTRLHLPVNYTFLAQCFGILGRPDSGLDSIRAAISAIEATEQKNWEPETWRVKGDLTLQQMDAVSVPSTRKSPAEVEAEECYRKAIEIAQRQHSKLFELRAAMCLSRLLKRLGRVNEARLLLSEVYNRFMEGFDSVDLKQARALLDALSV